MKTRKSIFSLDIRDDHTCGNVPAFQVDEMIAGSQGFLIVREARHV
jgi:hypothetical protein